MEKFAVVFILSILVISCNQQPQENTTPSESVVETTPVETKYGFRLDSFQVEEGQIKRDEFLSNILGDAGISGYLINTIAEKAKNIFSVRKMRYGKNYALIYSDSCSIPEYFVYEPSIKNYVTYELKDTLNIYVTERPINVEVEYFEGKLDSANTSLWLAMEETGVRGGLIAKMEEALGWTVDFYYVHRGDHFKAIFEKEYIDGVPVGVGKLIGAQFNTLGIDYHAILYENESYSGFYDLDGRPMIRKLLKSTVQYSRISSRYNLARYHPILKRRRPHFGTDYAAPRGTPIRAVADGTVIAASYTKGNGNYVKLRHDKIYQTQYLHMSKFGPGIKSGVRVRQGQTIGYVGSTGLATGPHVCFRFWKNGNQIDHLRLNFPPPQPMAEEELPKFMAKRDSVMNLYNGFLAIPDLINVDTLAVESSGETD